MHIAPMMNYFQMNQSSSFSKMQQKKKKVMPGNSGVLRSGAKKKKLQANQAKNAPEPPSLPLSLAH